MIPGDYLYAINGPTSQMIPVQGFTLHPLTESVVDHWDLPISQRVWNNQFLVSTITHIHIHLTFRNDKKLVIKWKYICSENADAS